MNAETTTVDSVELEEMMDEVKQHEDYQKYKDMASAIKGNTNAGPIGRKIAKQSARKALKRIVNMVRKSKRPIVEQLRKIPVPGRNQICPMCDSGMKWKYCHGKDY